MFVQMRSYWERLIDAEYRKYRKIAEANVEAILFVYPNGSKDVVKENPEIGRIIRRAYFE